MGLMWLIPLGALALIFLIVILSSFFYREHG